MVRYGTVKGFFISKFLTKKFDNGRELPKYCKPKQQPMTGGNFYEL